MKEKKIKNYCLFDCCCCCCLFLNIIFAFPDLSSAVIRRSIKEKLKLKECCKVTHFKNYYILSCTFLCRSLLPTEIKSQDITVLKNKNKLCTHNDA